MFFHRIFPLLGKCRSLWSWVGGLLRNRKCPSQDSGSLGRLSAYAVFSACPAVEPPGTGPAVNAGASQTSRERLYSGELFGALLPVAACGAVLVSRVVLSDAPNDEYVVTVVPTAL